MKRFAIGIYALFFVLAYVYLTTDDSSGAASAPAPAAGSGAAKAPAAGASFVPLFNAATKLEPPTIIDTPTALVTRVGDRGRDRHAREWMFHSYEHYLALYWVDRTVSIEVVDTVAKGGKTITFNMVSLAPLNLKDLRAFYEGKFSIAQYSSNEQAKETSPLHYTATVSMNTKERRPLKIGDRMEIEFSGFIKEPFEGRTNYYGTAFLYIVGQGGMHPWEWHDTIEDAHNWVRKTNADANTPITIASLDSFPLPEPALLGGMTTGHESYSDEPKSRFDEMATNMSPINTQPFVLGRRLAHTDFGTGVHSEPENPIFKEMVGKLGRASPEAVASTARGPCRRTWASRWSSTWSRSAATPRARPIRNSAPCCSRWPPRASRPKAACASAAGPPPREPMATAPSISCGSPRTSSPAWSRSSTPSGWRYRSPWAWACLRRWMKTTSPAWPPRTAAA